MKILAVDPSSTVLGYAVLDGDDLIAFGHISTSKVSYDMRFSHITNRIHELHQEHGFTEIACERAIPVPGQAGAGAGGGL